MNKKKRKHIWLWLLVAIGGAVLFFVGIWIGVRWKTWLMYPMAAGGWVIAVTAILIHFIESQENLKINPKDD